MSKIAKILGKTLYLFSWEQKPSNLVVVESILPQPDKYVI